jgi:hypothetical protein
MERELKMIVNGMGESTTTSYTGSYKRLRALLDVTDKRKPIKNFSLEMILERLDSVPNPSTKHSMYVIVKKLFTKEKDKDALDKFDQEIRKQKREHQIKKNGELNTNLPSYKEVNDAVKKAAGVKYIVSFLMLKVNTRNQDIALIDLHKSNKDNPIDIDELDKTRNHIILPSGFERAIYIRNVYKTAKKYGQKRNIIKVKQFINTVKDVMGDKTTMPLFSRRDGGKITTSSIGSYLKKYVVLGLNEGEIMKIVLKHIDDKGSYDMLRRVSNNRGTNIATLLTEYDVTNVKPPSTEVVEQEQTAEQVVVVDA